MWLPRLGGASPEGWRVDQVLEAVSRALTTIVCPLALFCQPYHRVNAQPLNPAVPTSEKVVGTVTADDKQGHSS